MKIVLISYLYEPNLGGGAANVVYSLAHDLVDNGIDVTVITSSPNRKMIVELQDGIKIIRFFPRNLYWVYEKEKQSFYKKVIWQIIDIWNPFVYQTVRKILEIEQPYLVHVHKLRGLSPSVWSAVHSVKINRLAHTCHDYELFSPEGWLNGTVGKWAQDRAIVMRPYQDIRAWVSSRVTNVSAPSQLALNMHTEKRFFKNSRKRVIPNSHGFSQKELYLLRKSAIRKKNHALRLLYIGRLVPEKGITQLCEAFKISSQMFPEMSLDIAGWGAMEALLQKRYSHIANIHFHGPVIGDKKDRLIRNADLIILPSIGPEIFGIVLVEAYAYGKPVIASRIGGIPEVVQDGVTGYLCKPGDVDDLVEKIQCIAGDPSILAKMSEACYEAARKYASDIISQQYLDMYRDA